VNNKQALPKKMKAAFLDKPGSITVREVSLPEYKSNQVLINVKEVGVCGSDLHYYNEGRIGDHIVVEPHILGHESAGMVVKTGSDVKDLKPGDRVSIEPGVPCLKCDLCRRGKYNLCDEMAFIGAPPYHGVFREYVAHDACFTYKLPDNVSYTQGALAEPLSVAYNGLSKIGLKPGDSVFITGAGPIGIACMEIAKIIGAATIIISDVSEYRMSIAKKCGATIAINPTQVDVVEIITKETQGKMCDCAVDTANLESTIRDAIFAVKKGGSISFVGLGREFVEIPYAAMMKKEITLKTVYRYANHYQPIIDLMMRGKLEVDNWISHRFKLEDIEEAMKTANDPKIDKLKMMISI
jgi:L-iditol 2-dehydrogenase